MIRVHEEQENSCNLVSIWKQSHQVCESESGSGYSECLGGIRNSLETMPDLDF